MKKAIIGEKIGMTQLFDEKGNVIPVTVIEAGPCIVSQKKTVGTDGYNSIQFGFKNAKPKNLNKPSLGHFEKTNIAPKKILHEFRFEDISSFEVGQVIKADVFEVGEKVDIIGKSKGKGYAGVIKRWNFGRLKETHGSGPVVRKGGSIGMRSDPSRVFKGTRMAGHLGCERVTVQNLSIVKIELEKNLIAVKGAVPGPNGGIVFIQNSVKIQK